MSNVRSFIILLSGEGLTSFNKINRVNFSGENRKTTLSRLSIFLEYKKNSLVVVFVLESKGYNTEDILPRFFKLLPFPLLKLETYPLAC